MTESPSAIRPRGDVTEAVLSILRERGEPMRARDVATAAAERLALTEEELALVRRASGKPTKWENEVQWAFQDLKHAGLARGLGPGRWVAIPGDS